MLILVILLVIVFVGVGIYFIIFLKPAAPVSAKVVAHGPPGPPPLPLQESQLPAYLSGQAIIKDLPKDANLEIRTTSNVYTVTKAGVSLGTPTSPDMTIWIPTTYVAQFTTKGFCQTLQAGYKSGEIGISLHTSALSAGWKYSSLMKYRSCIGA